MTCSFCLVMIPGRSVAARSHTGSELTVIGAGCVRILEQCQHQRVPQHRVLGECLSCQESGCGAQSSCVLLLFFGLKVAPKRYLHAAMSFAVAESVIRALNYPAGTHTIFLQRSLCFCVTVLLDSHSASVSSSVKYWAM